MLGTHIPEREIHFSTGDLIMIIATEPEKLAPRRFDISFSEP
jgi:hypothetical protein